MALRAKRFQITSFSGIPARADAIRWPATSPPIPLFFSVALCGPPCFSVLRSGRCTQHNQDRHPPTHRNKPQPRGNQTDNSTSPPPPDPPPCGPAHAPAPDPRRNRRPPRRRRLHRRPGPRHRPRPHGHAQPPAADRRRGRCRQNRSRQGARRRARHQPDPPAMLRRPRPVRRAVRVELPAPTPRHQSPRRRRRRRNRGGDLLRTLPPRPPAARRHPPGHRARPADRRNRPSRQRIRGFPARTPVRLPGLDPRTRHHRRPHHPACRADLQRHERPVGRPAPPVPVSPPGLPRTRPRGAHHPDPRARHRRIAGPADRAD